jgi:membrane-bound ClpP family serine protease
MLGLETAAQASAFWSAGLILGLMLLGVFLAAAFLVVAWRLRHWRGISGLESLAGAAGQVKTVSRDGVIVHVRSDDWWVLEAPDGLRPGQRVEVIGVEGLRVRIRSLERSAPKKRGGKS